MNRTLSRMSGTVTQLPKTPFIRCSERDKRDRDADDGPARYFLDVCATWNFEVSAWGGCIRIDVDRVRDRASRAIRFPCLG
jgi:hypothetical protein